MNTLPTYCKVKARFENQMGNFQIGVFKSLMIQPVLYRGILNVDFLKRKWSLIAKTS